MNRPFQTLVVLTLSGLLCVVVSERRSLWNLLDSTVHAQSRDGGEKLFVAPNGSPSNSGNAANPLDLPSVLKPGRVKPGATILLRAGTYSGPFRSDLRGTANAPIVMRSAPGEHAIITTTASRGDGGVLNVFGAWTVYRDFEVMNSNRDRGYGKLFRLMGLNIQAPHTKFINLVVHDAGHGFGFWNESVDSEIYGCIIYNGGTENTKTDMRHGHAIYAQNTEGVKLIRDNVMFDEFGWGISAYPGPGGVIGYHIEGNVAFNNGMATDARSHYNNILVSGHTKYITDKIDIVKNYTYYPEGQQETGKFVDANLCLGCSDPRSNGRATVTGNYFVNGSPVILANGFRELTIRDNTIAGEAALVSLNSVGNLAKNYQVDSNRYFAIGGRAAFILDGKKLDSKAWKATAGWDRSSTFETSRPSGFAVLVRPNEYEKGRAHVIVYNWEHRPEVSVDLSSSLTAGTRYEIYNVQDLSGSPVAQGSYDGRPVRLSMSPAPVKLPLGAESKLAGAARTMATGPEFSVFLVRPVAPVDALPPISRSAPPRSEVSALRGSGERDETPAPFRPFVGSYAASDGKSRATITFRGEGLVVEIAGASEADSKSYPLAQVSGPRFRLEGAPAGFFLQFNIEGQVVRGITFIRSIFPRVYMAKR